MSSGASTDSEETPLLQNNQSNSVLQNSLSNRRSPYTNQRYDSIDKCTTDCNGEENTSGNSCQIKTECDSETKAKDEKLESDSIEEKSVVSGFSFFALSRKHKMILGSVCMADFLSYLCLSLLAPFFPQEAADKGVNDTISGWIFGVFALSQVLFSPLFGKILPHVGLKFMYVAGLFLAGGTTILFGCMAFVNTDEGNETFIAYCFLLRVVLSLGCTGLNTACYTLTAKEFPDHIATVFGIGEVFVGIGFMSGPAVGGVLYGLGGFIMPFLVIGTILLLCVPLNWCILPSDDEFIPSDSNVSSLVLLRSPSVIVCCCAIVVASLIWSILDPTLEPHLRSFNLGPELIGVLFLVMSAFYAISSPIWGWISDKVSDNRLLLMLGFLLSGGGMLILGPSTLIGFPKNYNVLWLNILALVCLGTSASLALIPTFDIFIDVAETLGFEDDMATYGLVAGLWGSMYAFGDFLGPAMGGFLLDTVGFQWCCTITAFACFTMIPLLFINWICDKHCCKSKKVSTISVENLNNNNKTTVSTNDSRNAVFTESIESEPLSVDSWKDYHSDADLMRSYPPQRSNITENV